MRADPRRIGNVRRGITTLLAISALSINDIRPVVASELVVDGIASLEHLGVDTSKKNLKKLLNDSSADTTERIFAAYALADIDSPDAVSALRNALSDPEIDVRAASLEALSRLDDPSNSLIPKLRSILESDDEDGMKFIAMTILQEYDSEPASRALAKALTYDGQSDEVRSGIVTSLESMDTVQSIHALSSLLDDSSPVVASRAAIALSRKGSLEDISYLVDSVTNSETRPDVWDHALQELERETNRTFLQYQTDEAPWIQRARKRGEISLHVAGWWKTETELQGISQ